MANENSVIDTDELPQSPNAADQRLLLFSIFIIAGCSLIYELLISSLSTYLLGSGVVHYSVTIGLFLFFMGVGAWLAQYVKRDLLGAFVRVEILLGLVGGLSALILYAAYAWTQYYYPAMLVVIAIISILVGMEIPLLTRVIEQDRGIRQGLSEVLATDYVGALLASLLFPFILLPYLGHLLTAFAIGSVNLLVALVVVWHFRKLLNKPNLHVIMGTAAVLLLLVVSQFSTIFTGMLERSLYQDPVVHSEQSRYQKVVVTERGRDLRLFLNGSLQFSSLDEYRYHEPLIHLPASHSRNLERALIIGGGDGLAARELLRYESIKHIALVDLDPAVTDLGRDLDKLKALNQGSMTNPKVAVHNADAWRWLEGDGDLFDVIIIDLPDPDTADIARLYTLVFALGAALAGFAGALIGAIQSVQVGMGEPVLILAFVVIVIGGIGGALPVIFVPLLDKLKIDDVVGAIPVHLVAGIWGTLAVPLTNTEVPFIAQLTGVVATGAFVCITSAIVWFALKATIGVRPSEEEELAGLDVGETGIEAYPEFSRAN